MQPRPPLACHSPDNKFGCKADSGMREFGTAPYYTTHKPFNDASIQYRELFITKENSLFPFLIGYGKKMQLAATEKKPKNTLTVAG